ncbi:hypothetical protein BV20DRAFT_1055590 [Pilatotrama ljubarskyi]|nr:hypothetical protein BV20DRAFT_1055590 [Pilatotrama ljubarskyi]
MPASLNRPQHSVDNNRLPPVSGDQPEASGGGSSPSTLLSSGVDGSDGRGLYPVSRLPVFIDKVANALYLTLKYRGELHAFKEALKLALEMPPGFQRALLYQQASIYKTLQNMESLHADITNLKNEIKDIALQMTRQFILSEDQHDDILALAKAMVIEAGRDEFNFADEEQERLKNVTMFPHFSAVFNSKLTPPPLH